MILIPLFNNLGDEYWSKCAATIKQILQVQNLASLQITCYTILLTVLWKHPVLIANMRFGCRILLSTIFLRGAKLEIESCLPTPHQCCNCWKFGHPARYC